MNLGQKIHLKLRGWYEEGEKTFMECPIHGVTEAYVHGWKEKVDCGKCLQELLVRAKKPRTAEAQT